MTTVAAAASGLLILFAPWFGVPRLLSAVIAATAALTFVTYASWRQEVPPVDRWRDGEGRVALRDSSRVFAYAGLACVLGLFPLLVFAMRPEQSLRDSFSLAVLTAIILFSPALLWFGGIDLVLHATLRLVLSLTGTIPLRLRRFLDCAIHLGFLQRAGGGYIFFHRLLLEHFAARPVSDSRTVTKHPVLPPPSLLPDTSVHSDDQVIDNNDVVITAERGVVLNPAESTPHVEEGAFALAPPHDVGADVRILYLAANSTLKPLDLELELRRIEDHLLRGRKRDRLTLKSLPAVTVTVLMQTMMEEAPTHVHFSGHGESEGIVLRNELGDPCVVSGEALARLFRLSGASVRCVVLNACFSEPQAQCIRRYVPYVVGSTGGIEDAAALSFSSGFYLAVAAGMDVPYAFEAGKVRMSLDNVPGEEYLVLL